MNQSADEPTDKLKTPPSLWKDQLIHVGRPNVGDVEALIERVRGICERRWLSNDGPLVQEFERRVADIAGVKHCIAMCNATVALEIAVRAADISGEVIVPAYTFVATAHSLEWQKIRPIFCDIEAHTHNIDASKVEALITPQTRAIVGVHLWGRACDVDSLSDIAKRHGLHLMFDASHAFGSTYRNTRIGCFGLAEVFSFHATKFINCGEGGAVVTNDDALAAKMRLMRNFGFAGYDRVIYIGTNGKMSELSAAMGLTSLDAMESFLQTNRNNYREYQARLKGIPGISLLDYPSDEQQNYQYVVIEVDPTTCPLTRDQLVQALHRHQILARRYFYPGIHRMEPYVSASPQAYQDLPITEKVMNRVIILPTGTAVGTREIGHIASIIREATTVDLAQYRRLPPTIAPGQSFLEQQPS